MASSQQLPLDPAVIDELAVRLSDAVVARVIEVMRAEGVIPQPRAARAWLDAQEVARHLGVSREWVYEHVGELGASRIGNGPRPRLRFPPQILDFLDGKPASVHAPTRSAEPLGKANGLIPIHGA
jgi:predicted DNA-binding transcriptional regulator AlpA